MNVNEEDYWAGISARTSVREVAATTGGHGEPISHVASGFTSAWNSAGPSSCNVTANTHKQEMMQHTSAMVFDDLDYKGVAIYKDDDDEDDILQSPQFPEGASSATQSGPRVKPNKEGLKAKSQYKAAVKLCSRFDGKSNLSSHEAERLTWAKDTVKKGRAYYATQSWCIPSDPRYANRIEEEILKNIQHSTERVGPSSRRQTQQREDQNRETPFKPERTQAKSERMEEHFRPKRERVVSEVKEPPSKYKPAPAEWFIPSDPRYANRSEEEILKNTQHSTERAGPSNMRQTQQREVQNRETPIKPERTQAKSKRMGEHFRSKREARAEKETPSKYKPATVGSQTTERPIVMALIDRSDASGIISEERWKLVEMKLLEAMFVKMDAEPDQPMPSFDGAGWFQKVKMIKCKDYSTLLWLQAEVKTLQGLWHGARLDVVNRSTIPALPTAKVLIPRVVKPEQALRLLQRQNPDVPTDNWMVIKVESPTTADAGQTYTLQINQEAKDILYARFGKMTWGVGSVYLRLKKRLKKDGNQNTWEAEEVEEDFAEQAYQPCQPGFFC